jgi:hypothetical protein
MRLSIAALATALVAVLAYRGVVSTSVPASEGRTRRAPTGSFAHSPSDPLSVPTLTGIRGHLYAVHKSASTANTMSSGHPKHTHSVR